MGLKDKMQKVWKRVSDLEDESESVNGQAKSKERIPYKEISKKLKEIMKENVDVVGRRIVVPNYYAIYFNEFDRNMRVEVEDVLCDELKEELYHEMRKINPEQSKRDILIEIKTDPSLQKGHFRIEHHIKKPTPEDWQEERSEVAGPVEEVEIDYEQTVIENGPVNLEDEQKTVVQQPVSGVHYKLLVDSGEKKEEMLITKAFISIGRGTKDDVIIPSPDYAISRSHVTLEVREGNFYLTPSGVNGTFLNGQELELKKEVQITPNDEIKIINYTLRIVA